MSLTIAQKNAMLKQKLLIGAQGLNGEDVFDSKTILFGFVEAHERLPVPKKWFQGLGKAVVVNGAQVSIPSTTVEDFGNSAAFATKLATATEVSKYTSQCPYTYNASDLEYVKVALMSFYLLVSGGYNTTVAFQVSAYRMRWAMTGALHVAKQDSRQHINEIDEYGGKPAGMREKTKDEKRALRAERNANVAAARAAWAVRVSRGEVVEADFDASAVTPTEADITSLVRDTTAVDTEPSDDEVKADPSLKIRYIAGVLDRMADATTFEDLTAVDQATADAWLTASSDTKRGIKYVVRTAETFLACAEFMMRVRGHHYKDENAELAKKFIVASFEGTDDGANVADLKSIIRTAIHPFGLKALPVMTAHYALHSKLGNAAQIRFSGAPNGFAVVTTTAAALRAMQTEAWWPRFEEANKNSLELLYLFDESIRSNKFTFHTCAYTYGAAQYVPVVHNGKAYSLEQIRDAGANLASIAAGFVSALETATVKNLIDGYALRNAKVLKKYAGNAPLASLRVKILVEYAIKGILDAETLEEAIDMALPRIG